jgi:hypothetical protein
MKKLNEMNGNERIAYKNIKGVFDYEVGGWYNCVQDDCLDYIPDTLESAKSIIYSESLTDRANGESYWCGRAPQEMRFAGAEFIKEVIDYLFATDGDALAIAECKAW